MKTFGIFWIILLVLIGGKVRSQTQTVYLAPCYKLEMDTSQLWADVDTFGLPSRHMDASFRKVAGVYFNVYSYQIGPDFLLPDVIESYDTLERHPYFEKSKINRNQIQSFQTAEIEYGKYDCFAINSESKIQVDPLVEWHAWSFSANDKLLYVTCSFSLSLRSKTTHVLEEFLSHIAFIDPSEMDRIYHLPWSKTYSKKRIEEFNSVYYSQMVKQFHNNLECGDVDMFHYELSKTFGEAIIDSLYNHNLYNELADYFARYHLIEANKFARPYFESISEVAFTFQEETDVRSKILTKEYTFHELASFYFDHDCRNDFTRANEFQIYDVFSSEITDMSAQQDFGNGFHPEYISRFGEYEFSHNDKFKEVLIRIMEARLFSGSRSIDMAEIRKLGNNTIIDISFFYDTMWQSTKWLGLVQRDAEGIWTFNELKLPVDNRNEFDLSIKWDFYSGDDYLLLQSGYYWVRDSLSEYWLMPLTEGMSEWKVVEVLFEKASTSSKLVHNYLLFNGTTPDSYSNEYFSSFDMEVLQDRQEKELLERLYSADSTNVRDTVPDEFLPGLIEGRWIEIMPGKYASSNDIISVLSDMLMVHEKLYSTDLLFDDLNGDGIDEVFHFSVQNGELKKYHIYTVMNGNFTEVSGKKWKNLLLKTDYFLNLSHYSMIGKHGNFKK